MNKIYEDKRIRQGKISRITGAALAVSIHLVALCFGVTTGLKYIYPPPPEDTILIDFSEEEYKQPQIRTGHRPKAKDPDKTKDINLVQNSEAQEEGAKLNESKEATLGEDGDVDVFEPKREVEIKQKALFHSAKNITEKDTLSPQTAYKKSEKLKAGHAAGNTNISKLSNKPNALLEGRSQVGSLPTPLYGVQNEGTVVVEIWVDNYGTVKKALAGAPGTDVTDKTLWNAARNAAMKSVFNQKTDAPTLQKGTITYVFKLK